MLRQEPHLIFEPGLKEVTSKRALQCGQATMIREDDFSEAMAGLALIVRFRKVSQQNLTPAGAGTSMIASIQAGVGL
jgi:hypothetical protein